MIVEAQHYSYSLLGLTQRFLKETCQYLFQIILATLPDEYSIPEAAEKTIQLTKKF